MRPYPFERLRHLSREQAVAISRWARSAPVATLVRGGRDAGTWLGETLRVTLGQPGAWTGASIHRDGAFVLLEDEAHTVGLQLGPAIASAMIERTLGATGEAFDARGPLDEVERGVLAYAVGRWLGASRWRVGTVLAYAPGLVEAVNPQFTWPLELALGSMQDRGELWLTEPRSLGVASPRALPAWFPIEMRVDAGEATLNAQDIASLETGDIVLPDRLDPDELRLHARQSSLVLVCRAPDLELVRVEDGFVTATHARAPQTGEERMTDSAIAKLGDTPVTLHVEVARVETTIGDLAAVSVGEVVRTGRTISERVTLRAGSRTVAWGELVDVDGELGVQITELAE